MTAGAVRPGAARRPMTLVFAWTLAWRRLPASLPSDFPSSPLLASSHVLFRAACSPTHDRTEALRHCLDAALLLAREGEMGGHAAHRRTAVSQSDCEVRVRARLQQDAVGSTAVEVPAARGLGEERRMEASGRCFRSHSQGPPPRKIS
jgi:hypothetical protein